MWKWNLYFLKLHTPPPQKKLHQSLKCLKVLLLLPLRLHRRLHFLSGLNLSSTSNQYARWFGKKHIISYLITLALFVICCYCNYLVLCLFLFQMYGSSGPLLVPHSCVLPALHPNSLITFLGSCGLVWKPSHHL